MSRTLAKTFALVLAAAALLCAGGRAARAQARGTEAIPVIDFKPGRRTVTLMGKVTLPHGEGDMHNDGADRYSLSYRAGQRITVVLRSQPAGAVFSITRQDGGESPNIPPGTRWSGRLPATGDYLINVFTQKGPANYILKVTRG